MRPGLLLIGSILVFAASCETSSIVVTHDEVVNAPLLNDIGLAGEWRKVPDPEYPGATRDVMTVEGPDESGFYALRFASSIPSDKPLVMQAVVQQVPGHPDFLLVDATCEGPEETEQPWHFLAYIVVRKEHLHIAPIYSRRLLPRFESLGIEPKTKHQWICFTVSANEGELRRVLSGDPNLLVESVQTFARTNK